MSQLTRVLAVVFQQSNGVLRFKIAYKRSLYPDYDIKDGDQLDESILRFFQNLNPTKVYWECISCDQQELGAALAGLTCNIIPLVIFPTLDGLDVYQKDAITQQNQIITPRQGEVTLYYRPNITEDHEYWKLLPKSIDSRVHYNFFVNLDVTTTAY